MAVNSTPFPHAVNEAVSDFLQSAINGEPADFRMGLTASEDIVLVGRYTERGLTFCLQVSDYEYYEPFKNAPGDTLSTSGEFFSELAVDLEALICAYFPDYPSHTSYVTLYNSETRAAAFLMETPYVGDSDE